MAGRVEIYRASDGWRWCAVAPNGEIVATGEAYSRRFSAKRAARKLWPGWTIVG